MIAVRRGKQVYRERCASCHGRYLQGQPLWQLADQYAGWRAPAHDQTGHTWRHPDDQLFHMTKYGQFADAPDKAASAMPAFKDVLDDQEILAVIAYIKASWPIGLRVLQAMGNPGRAGMPREADRGDWKFPPNCMATSPTREPNAR
jgi:mono/diheme cytochrome c family protein